MQSLAKLTLSLALACLLLGNLQAGEKKKEDKKPEPAKDIIIDGELINADLKDKVHQQSFCKTYTFKMEKGKSYQIEMGSKSYQSVLRLEDSTGRQVAQAMDPFGNQKAVIYHQCTKTEDYEVVVTTGNGGATGKFTLAIKDATNSTVLAHTDKLDQNDKVYAGANKKHKLYLVTLEEGRTYQIDMTSGQFDSYLFFESPEGKLLAQDDDGGGYPSARIIYKINKTGKYRVICTYFGGGNVNGQFNISVRQTDGPPRTIVEPKVEEKKQ